VDAQGGKSLEVGLDAGATAAIGAGDCEDDGSWFGFHF
jgi:hypothetical protein